MKLWKKGTEIAGEKVTIEKKMWALQTGSHCTT